MKLQIKLFVQMITQFADNLRSKKAAKELLNLTDKQLKGLGLTRDIVAQKINLQDWSVLNFDEVNTIDANFINAKEGTLISDLPANDEDALFVA